MARREKHQAETGGVKSAFGHSLWLFQDYNMELNQGSVLVDKKNTSVQGVKSCLVNGCPLNTTNLECIQTGSDMNKSDDTSGTT